MALKTKGVSLVPLSLCPGTRAGANVLGQSPLSRDVPRDKIGRKNTKKRSKMVKKCIFLLIFLLSRICPGSWYIIDSPHCTWYIINFWIPFASFLVSRSVILHLVIVPERDGTACQKSRPVPWQDFELVPLSLCPGTMKKLLSLCPEKFPCPVPLETLSWTRQFAPLSVSRSWWKFWDLR